MSHELAVLFGMLDLSWQVLKVLALIGAVTTGGLLGGWLLWGLVRLVTRRQLPRPATLAARALGGAGLGVAVWLWVFGEGGGGPGRGGLWGVGDGQGQTPGVVDLHPARGNLVLEAPSPQSDRVPEAAEGVGSDTLRIELLGGGRVKEGRFYILDGEREARALGDLKRRIEERQRQRNKVPLKAIELVIYQNSVAEDHAAVRDLRKWAREKDLEVKIVSVDRELP
jgi:hypothetical protein